MTVQRYFYASFRRSIFDSIGNEVNHNLLQAVAIHINHDTFLRTIEGIGNSTSRGSIFESVKPFFRENLYVGRFRVKPVLVFLHFPKSKKLIDQPRHTPRASIKHIHRTSYVRRHVRNITEPFQCDAYQGKRSTEFMRYISEKVKLIVGKLPLHTDFIPQRINMAERGEKQETSSGYQQYINNPRPPCLPERRLDNYRNCRLVSPHTVSVAGLDMQCVITGKQIAV